MKKIITGVLLSIMCFFFFGEKANAAVNFTLNYDLNDHFNYFYEQKNNTPIYQFLTNQSISDFEDFFLSNTYFTSSTYIPKSSASLVLFKIDSITDFLSKAMGVTNFPVNSEYVFLYTSFPFSFYAYNGGYNIIVDNPYYHNFHTTLYYFDANANFISKQDVSSYFSEQSNCGDRCFAYGGNGYSVSSFSVFNNDLTIDEITYIISSLYYKFNDNVSFGLIINSSLDFRLTKIINYGEVYRIKDLETRSGFANFWSKISNTLFNSGQFEDLNDLGLSYFLKYYYVSPSDNTMPLPLYTILNYGKKISYSVPNDYENISFSYSNRYYLVPNNLSCSNSESLLYFNTTDTSSINIINYHLQDGNKLSYDFGSYSFSLNNANAIEALMLSDIVSPYTDYVYLIYSSDNFSVNNIYYNSNCFSIYSAIDSGELTFTNINTGENITLTQNEKNYINGLADKYFKENIKVENDNLDLDNILSSAWSNIKVFVSSSISLVSLATGLFYALPAEVSSLLLLIFNIGLIILVWKLFH